MTAEERRASGGAAGEGDTSAGEEEETEGGTAGEREAEPDHGAMYRAMAGDAVSCGCTAHLVWWWFFSLRVSLWASTALCRAFDGVSENDACVFCCVFVFCVAETAFTGVGFVLWGMVGV